MAALPSDSKKRGGNAARKRFLSTPRTLIFITHDNHILFLKGAPDKPIWPNRFNGIGGHIEHGETILDAARREIVEETGLPEVADLWLCAIISVDTPEKDRGILLFVFRATSPTTQTRHSPEGNLEWLTWEEAIKKDLVEDLPWLVPQIMGLRSGEPPLYARYWYDRHQTWHVALSTR